MNVCIFTGNLTKDPELRTVGEGKSVTTLRMAVKGGREETLFINVTVWDRSAENCVTYLSKGSPVTVRGELKPARVYTARSGEARADLEVTADRYNGVEFGRSEDRQERPKFTNQTPHEYRGGQSSGDDDGWSPF
jgi:single-strand DNA-binding protein